MRLKTKVTQSKLICYGLVFDDSPSFVLEASSAEPYWSARFTGAAICADASSPTPDASARDSLRFAPGAPDPSARCVRIVNMRYVRSRTNLSAFRLNGGEITANGNHIEQMQRSKS